MSSQAFERTRRAVGLRVRELRVALGVTQEEAAERLRMQAPNYARIEQGRMNLTLETMIRLASFLGVEPAELLRPPKPQRVRLGRPRKVE